MSLFLLKRVVMLFFFSLFIDIISEYLFGKKRVEREK